MSGFSTSSIVGVCPSERFLILWSTASAGRKSAGAAAITTASAPCTLRTHGVVEFGSGDHRVDRDASGVGQVPRWPLPGSPRRREPRRRPPARTPACPTSGCRGSGPGRGTRGCRRPTRPRGVRSRSSSADSLAAQDVDGVLEDLLRLGQPTRAGVDAGEPADGGLDHVCAASTQRRDVVLGRRVLPHLGVHGRCEHDRTARHQQRRWSAGRRRDRAPPWRAGRQWPGRRRPDRPPVRGGRAGRTARQRRRRRAPACPDSASQVAVPTNFKAAAVGTTVTSCPDSVKRRSSSQALYAAMPPLTPSTTRGRLLARLIRRRGHDRPRLSAQSSVPPRLDVLTGEAGRR